MPKTYSQTYLFKQYSGYEKSIYGFIINAERVETSSNEFADILFDIKRRRISDSLAKVLTSPNVVLGLQADKGLPKAFKTFVAADAKMGISTPKAFIDGSECVVYKNGAYVCTKLEWLISYTISAMVNYIYALQENKLTGNASVLKEGGDAWVRCFSYIIDRLYKISTVQDLKIKVDYVASIYYQISILGKDPDKQPDSILANAIRMSNIDPKSAKVVDIMLDWKDFENIDTFRAAISRIFKLKDLTTSAIVDMWMKCFGTGTVFALEYFPAFSTMMTNTYIGGYIDQQMTIEKIAGSSMVKFVKAVLEIGGRAVS